MKRNMELIRDLLLRLEGLPKTSHERLDIGSWDDELKFDDYTPDEIDYHMGLLYEADIITSSDTINAMANGAWIFDSLTWAGHDFLDSVRDPEVWKRTKAGALTVGGWTFGMLKEFGVAYLKQVAKERLHLEL